MNVQEIESEVMFQTNNDAEDLGDFLPYLLDYINEGYDKLLYAWCKEHPSQTSAQYPLLSRDRQSPATPEWTHRAICDYATWLVYRNGNVQKQSRGMKFLQSFEEVMVKVKGLTDAEKGLVDSDGNSTVTKYNEHFKNIPW